MKFVLAAASALALAALTGCCCTTSNKCYPYPLYDYSPAKMCGTACAPAPCAPAPCAPCGMR